MLSGCSCSSIEHDLPREEGLGVTARRVTLDSTQASDRLEGAAGEPRFAALSGERSFEGLDFEAKQFIAHRKIGVGSPKVAFVLDDLVLEYWMAPKMVPGQFRDD